MFQFQPRYLGVEWGKHHARFAKLHKTRTGWSVSLQQLSKEEDIPQFCASCKDYLLVTALPTKELLVRPCEMALTKPKDIFAALHFHAEPLLPYPIEKALLQAHIVKQEATSSSLNIFSVRKDHLLHHLDSLKTFGIQPEVVTTRPHALANLSSLFQKQNALLMVHEADDELSMVLVEQGHVLAARSIDLKTALKAEIQKTYLSFVASYKTKSIHGLYYFGTNNELQDLVVNSCGLPLLEPSCSAFSLTDQQWRLFGLAIGCALSSKGVNFCQKEFAPKPPFQRLKKPLLVYIGLSLLFTLSLFVWEKKTLIDKENTVNEAYRGFLQAEQVIPQPCTKPEEYLASLNNLEREIATYPKTFPLLPQVPKVKELLGWLTSLNQELSSSLTIESLHYHMVKRPAVKQTRERYKVKVELTFSTKDLSAARLFQEMLKGADSLADTKEEIQWSSSKGKYKTSFFLKDKTRYT